MYVHPIRKIHAKHHPGLLANQILNQDYLRRQDLPETFLRDVYEYLDVYYAALFHPRSSDMGLVAPSETISSDIVRESVKTFGFA